MSDTEQLPPLPRPTRIKSKFQMPVCGIAKAYPYICLTDKNKNCANGLVEMQYIKGILQPVIVNFK